MATKIARTRERTASPQELADDRRRYLEAKAATTAVDDLEPVPGEREPGNALLEGWALAFRRPGSEDWMRLKCPKEELKPLAIKLVEEGVASVATAEHTTVEIICEVEDFMERTTTIETTTQVDWAVREREDEGPVQVEGGLQS